MISTPAQTQYPIHPCDSWANTAGYENWKSALVAMNEGKVLAGPLLAIQPSSKSMLGMSLFMEMVGKEQLHTYCTDEDAILVGHQKNFPAEVLTAQEKKLSAMADRFKKVMPH